MSRPPDVWCKRCFGEVINGRCRECGGQNSPMPLSSKEKQEAYRARQAMLGMKEVRGIFLPEPLHAALKEQAAKLLKAHAKKSPHKEG